MLDSDIMTYHSEEVSSNDTNGGRRGTAQVVSGVVNNVWPHVTKAERTAGSTLFRKLHILAADDNDGILIAAQEYLDNPTPGEDYIVAFEGTKEDTQVDINASARKYGSASVSTDISANSATFDVDVEHIDFATGTHAIFQVGDEIRVTDKVTPDAVSGNEEFRTIQSVTNVDTVVTITVTVNLVYGYLISGDSRVSTIIDFGDIKTLADNYVVVTAGDGTFDDALYPLTLDNIGTVEDVITFAFTDATHFTATGTSGINYGSADTDVGTYFEPTNAAGKPYFRIEFAGFVDTWAGSDTLTVDVQDASFPLWLKRIVPAGCASLANNKLTSVTLGESDA